MYDPLMWVPMRSKHIELSQGGKHVDRCVMLASCTASVHPDISDFWVIMQTWMNPCGNGVSIY